MPATVEERHKSRRCEEGANPWEERDYLVFGATTDDEARVAVATAAPSTVPGRASSSIAVTLGRVSLSVTPLGGTLFDATVRYAAGTIEPGNTTTRFRTGGGSQHIIAARASRRYAGSIPTADTGRLIAVRDDGEVDGVDITVPVYEWSERHILSPATVTAAYRAGLYGLTGSTNAAAFRGFAAAEVLFLGAEGEQRRYGNWELDFAFAASPNLANLTLGAISGILKRGWEFLDQRTRRTVTPEGYVSVRVEAVYSHEVFPAGDFAALGIGTT